MKETANERVRKAINWLIDNGYATSNRVIAEKMMYNQSTLSLILNGKINVKERFVRTFCRATGGHINPDWILCGEGEMVKGTKAEGEEQSDYGCPVTISDIIKARTILETKIAESCAQFTDFCYIPVTSIKVTNSSSKRGFMRYGISIPIELPSVGEAANCSNFKVDFESKEDDTDEDMPPVEFEEALVSACLKDGSIIGKVEDYLSPEMFSDKKLGAIYGAMIAITDKGIEVTAGSLADCAKDFVIDWNVLMQTKCRVANTNHAEFYADCIYNYAVQHNPEKWCGLALKESTQINPEIKENYEKLCKATGVSAD